MSQESNQPIFPHRRPSFIRTLIEDARNIRFVRRYQLDHGDTESRPNQLADETKNISVWLSNIDRLVKHCPPPPARTRFIDVGSGAGIACIYAALRFTFSEVIGVEHDPRHLATAKSNLTKMADVSKTAKISFVQADASSYQFPAGENYLFLFNPFGGKTFEKMMKLNCANFADHQTYLLLANDHLLSSALNYGELLWRDTRLNLSLVKVR